MLRDVVWFAIGALVGVGGMVVWLIVAFKHG